MNIYLSEFSVLDSISRGNSYDDDIDEFLSFCQKNNLSIFRSDEFSDYETIESKIRKSNLLVAFVDDYWLSSTWKLHELLYSIGDYAPMGKEGGKAENLDVAIFYVKDIDAPILENIKLEVTELRSLEDLKSYVLSRNYA